MKTYIKTTLTILISGMLFSSCEDQLNQANPNQATEDTFWKDETDFNLALPARLQSASNEYSLFRHYSSKGQYVFHVPTVRLQH